MYKRQSMHAIERIIFAFVILLATGIIFDDAHGQENARPQEATSDYADANIREITKNLETWEDKKVLLQGIVDRYDDAETNTLVFHLEDDYGYRIKIQTAYTLPAVKSKIFAWGTLKGDPGGMELYLSMEKFADKDKPDDAAKQKPLAWHKNPKSIILISGFILIIVLATVIVFLMLRKRSSARNFQPAQGVPGALQRNMVEQVDTAATIKIDLEKIKIMQLAPTVKLLPGHFIITKGNNQGKTLPICFKEVIIGRACPNDPQNKIAIEDSSKTISRNQAILTYENNVFYIENKVDPGRKNSICLNGTPLKKDQKCLLINNSIMSVGYVEIKFVEGLSLSGKAVQATAPDAHDTQDKATPDSEMDKPIPSDRPTAQTFVGRAEIPNAGDRQTAQTVIKHPTNQTIYKK